MGEGTYDGRMSDFTEKVGYDPSDMCVKTKEESDYIDIRCQRIYGCIECRSTLVYLGVTPEDQELFQCQDKKCSKRMKVLMIRPNLIKAKIIAP